MKSIISILVIICSTSINCMAQVNKEKGRLDTTIKLDPDAPLKTHDSMYRDRREDWAGEYDTTTPPTNLGYPFDTTNNNKPDKSKADRKKRNR